MQWIQVPEAGEIPPRQGRAMQAGHFSIAVFNLGERFLAVENRCPVDGGPLIHGILGGTTITCPIHNWRICLETGLVIKPAVEGIPQIRTFPVRFENGAVLIGLAAKPAAA
jgi:nitrite reductase (NADH) small subunit